MSLMTRGASFIQRSLSSAGGETIVITPLDGLGTITVTNAVPGKSEVDVTQPGQANSRREINQREYLVPVASLVRNGSTVLPAAGDRYAVTINSVAYTFQVMPISGNAAWDWADHMTRTQVRVRLKKV
jgi:hypothetical protein